MSGNHLQSKLSILFLFFFNFLNAQTDVYIGVELYAPPPKRVFLASFRPTTQEKNAIETAIAIRETVRADLLFSRYFEINEDQLNPLSLEYSKKAFEEFSKNSNYYIFSQLDYSTYAISMKGFLFELPDGKILLEKRYDFTATSMRKAAHMFSDDITFAITGKKGIASSKIAFSNDSTGFKEIYMSDYDGENLIRLTNHKSISILPLWDNDGYKIYYTTYKKRNPDIYEIDLKKGMISPFSTYQGLNVSGGFSPDGLNLAITLSRGSDPSIYLMETRTKKLKKLIKNFSVSSSPTYSPDGKEIAFVSDISGNPQLHIYDFESGKTRKITRLNWADSPNWSPDGKWIVFSGRETAREKMNIFITDPTGSKIKRLTRNEGDNEDPCFSPDGRFILFTSTRRGRREIFLMDLDGSAPHPLNENLKGNSYTPSWSK